MYGLDPATDLAFFAGLRVLGVSEWEHGALLRFEQETELSLNDCEYSLNGARFAVGGAQRLNKFVGAIVVGALVSQPGELRLQFDSGDVLVAHDSNAPQYESYTVTIGDRWIVV